MGLATAGLIYALLVKRFAMAGWAAALATVPVLFDAYQIQLETLIMSDAMFILLVTGVITLVLWHRSMTWKVGAAVGGLLALTALTRVDRPADPGARGGVHADQAGRLETDRGHGGGLRHPGRRLHGLVQGASTARSR